MKAILVLAAAAIAVTASPALADKGGHGHGDKQWKHGGDGDDRGGDRDDRNRHGQRFGDRDRGDDHRDRYNSSYRHCPPGLARKHNGCLPPGQARHRWERGQRLPSGYNGYTSYDRIPQSYRDRYRLNRNNRYIYENGTVYQVDPRTQIIQQILGGLIR